MLLVWGDVEGIEFISEGKRDPIPLVVSMVPKLTPSVGVSGMSELEMTLDNQPEHSEGPSQTQVLTVFSLLVLHETLIGLDRSLNLTFFFF